MLRALFVVPSEISSGEAITVRHVVSDIVAHEGSVRVLGSRLVEKLFADRADIVVDLLSSDVRTNEECWSAALRDFGPDVVIFADYPLLAFPAGSVTPFSERWHKRILALSIPLVTLDHLGYAQRPMRVFFGPPHRSRSFVDIPQLPAPFGILLPSPMQSPAHVSQRRGTPFRSNNAPQPQRDRLRDRIRKAYLPNGGGYLVVHSTPAWARENGRRLGLAYYPFFGALLQYCFGDATRPVTVVSINDGALLEPSRHQNVRLINVKALPVNDFDALVAASDLMITDNRVSSSLGKAICSLTPCAVLVNRFRLFDLLDRLNGTLRDILLGMEASHPGSVFPHDVFPIWDRSDVESLGLYRENPFAEAFETVEAFGGEATCAKLLALLEDAQTRTTLIARQEACVAELARLDGGCAAVSRALARPTPAV